MERRGNLQDMDRAFDLEYWQRQPAAARLAAVWELVVAAYAQKGEDLSALRLARHQENLIFAKKAAGRPPASQPN
jgi:hypothetical protein